MTTIIERHAGTRVIGRVNLGVVSWLGLLAVPIALLRTYPLTDRGLVVQALQLGLIFYSATRLAMFVGRGQFPWFAITFWLFVYTILGIAQMVQLSSGTNPLDVSESDSLITTQLLVIWVGCLVFDVIRSKVSAREGPARSPRVVTLASVVWLDLFAIVITPFLVQHFGGISTVLEDRSAVAGYLNISLGQQSTTDAILLGVGNVVPFVALFALLQLRRAGEFTFTGRPSMILLLVLLLGSNFLLNNPISQPRFWIATMAAALLYTAKWAHRPGGLVIVLAGFIFTSTVLFPYLDLFRYSGIGQATVERHSVGYFMENKTDYGSPVDITNSITYAQERGHTDGRQLAGDVLFFVPRSVWPGKPVDTGELFAELINYNNLNLDAPPWAEGYIDFGFAGVVGVLGIYGLLMGFGDRRLRLPVKGAPLDWALVFLPVAAGYELILLRGSLLQAMGRLSVLIVVCAAISRRAPAD